MTDAQQVQIPEGRPSLLQVRELQKDGKLIGFRCTKCGRTQVSPMYRCSCGSFDVKAQDLPLTGKVVSYTIQRVSAEEFINEVPYAWAVVELDDGTRVSGWIGYISTPKDLAIGAKVKYTSAYKPGVQFEKA